METLTAAKRDMGKKAKALRKQGFITGIVYGKEMSENIPIQISAVDAGRFMKNHSKGSQATLELEGKCVNVLLKDTDYDPTNHQYLSLDFQALVEGEKVHSTAPIILLNEEKVVGFLTHNLSELAYKAVPSALIEKIEIDVSALPVGTNFLVKDLEIAKNPAIDIITPGDALILHIAEHQKHSSADETEAAAETEQADA
ncbi:MAG: 50S ribosomal protein L25 [Hespellia sp.]|nr:50S ribosomal protein L25 [Hespellia sp.]